MEPVGMKRESRRGPRHILLLAASLVMLPTMLPAPALPPLRARADAVIHAEPVPLNRADPASSRVGDLVFLRGWALSSGARGFGGISAMHVEDGAVIALNDAGILFRFALPRRAGTQPLAILPLPDQAAGPKSSHDSEAMAVDAERAWIGFERTNRVARYRRADWARAAAAQPRAMRGWRGNSGAEAMVRLADGRFLILAEGRSDGGPTSPVLLFGSDPSEPGARADSLSLRRIAGYRVTDAALLPDGRLLVLMRRFSLGAGASARLLVVEAGAIRPGATLAGREIADLRAPLSIDNMEALSVAREGGRTIVRLASDDNFVAFQRTLLLEFALDER